MLGRREFLKWVGLAPVGVVGAVVGLQSRGGMGDKTPHWSNPRQYEDQIGPWHPPMVDVPYLTSDTQWFLLNKDEARQLNEDQRKWRIWYGDAL